MTAIFVTRSSMWTDWTL